MPGHIRRHADSFADDVEVTCGPPRRRSTLSDSLFSRERKLQFVNPSDLRLIEFIG